MTLVDKLVKDPWKDLRKDLFRNVEPIMNIKAITMPSPELIELGMTPETLPAYAARKCYDSSSKYTQDPNKNFELDKKLLKNLIESGHDTPLQTVNYLIDFDGTSKALQAQWTRHKVGVGWCYESKRYVNSSANKFVYNIYNYINDEKKVKKLLKHSERKNKIAIKDYDTLISQGVRKEDARMDMPTSYSSGGTFFANARAIRHFLKLRLDKPAQWEIRRFGAMMLDELMNVTPILFEDIYDKFSK